MANISEIRNVITADDKTRAAVESAKRGMTDMGRHSRSVSESMSRHWSSVSSAFKAVGIAVTAALASATYATYKAIAAANVQDAAEKALEASLGRTSQALLAHAAALQQQTTFGDESIIKAQALIGAFVKEDEAIKRATEASLDLAAAKGMDLNAAADLVAKTLGSSTNALARYGVQVDGAVGSSQRLESLTRNIATLFGGQAAAQAQTFGGRVKQLRNAYGDLWEELGMIITRSQFFRDVVALITEQIGRATQYVHNHRDALMDMAENGLISVAKGISATVELLRFFHNGWLGVKLVGQAALSAIAVNLEITIKGLRLMLLPLDEIFKGLKSIGAIENNPFDKLQDSIVDFRAAAFDATGDTLRHIDETNKHYDVVKKTVDGLVGSMKALRTASKTTETANNAASTVSPAVATANAMVSKDKTITDAAAYAAYGGAAQEQRDIQAVYEAQWAEEDRQKRLDQMAQERADEEYNNQLKLYAEAYYRQQDLDAAAAHEKAKAELKRKYLSVFSQIGYALYQASDKQNKQMFAAYKAFAIADALVNTYKAAANALASGPFPWTLPYVALAIATGMAQVKAIQSQTIGGGAAVAPTGAGASYSPVTATAPAEGINAGSQDQAKAKKPLNVNLNIYGDIVDMAGFVREKLAPALKEAVGDGFDVGLQVTKA